MLFASLDVLFMQLNKITNIESDQCTLMCHCKGQLVVVFLRKHFVCLGRHHVKTVPFQLGG